MIARLWTIITSNELERRYCAAKEFLFRRALTRRLCYFGIAAALLLYWLNAPAGVVGFVYSAF